MSTIASHLPLNILETVRDKGLVPKDHQQEMAYGVSNDYMTPKDQADDPNTPQYSLLE